MRQRFATVIIHTFEKFPFEKLDAHYGKNKPEEKADEKNIKDGRDGLHKGIYDDLKMQYVAL